MSDDGFSVKVVKVNKKLLKQRKTKRHTTPTPDKFLNKLGKPKHKTDMVYQKHARFLTVEDVIQEEDEESILESDSTVSECV